MAKTARCLHCATPLGVATATGDHGDFCCRGCAIVYRILHEEGLARFYRFRRGRGVPATHVRAHDTSSLHAPYLETLDESQNKLGEGETFSRTLSIQGLHCSACVWLVNTLFHRQHNAEHIDVNVARGEIHVTAGHSFSFRDFAAELARFGYLRRRRSYPCAPCGRLSRFRSTRLP